MNLPLESIKSLIGAAADGTITQPEITRLVQISRVVIQLHLRSKTAAVSFLTRHHGISSDDLAYDCLGELFLRNSGAGFGKFEQLVKSLGRGFSGVGAPEVFIAYRGLLVKIAEAYVARLYALADPEGGRIYRNVREFVKRNDGYTIRRSPGGLILGIGGEGSEHGGRLFPGDVLERECLSRRSEIGSTPDLLAVIRSVLAGSPARCDGVLLFDVARVMKRFHDDGMPDGGWDAPPDVDGLTSEDVNRIRDDVLRALRKKIIRTYIDPGKLTAGEGEDLFLALRDIVGDWCEDAAASRPLYEYLNLRRPMDAGVYESRYKAKLEYLVKHAREAFEAFLLREL